MVFFFDNGRVSKVPLESYKTVTNRKRLINAYCDKFALVRAEYVKEDREFALTASNNKVLIVNTALIPVKASKSTQGVIVFTQKAKNTVTTVCPVEQSGIKKTDYYRTKSIPAVGHFLREADLENSDQETIF